jgi:hypothetical protein
MHKTITIFAGLFTSLTPLAVQAQSFTVLPYDLDIAYVGTYTGQDFSGQVNRADGSVRTFGRGDLPNYFLGENMVVTLSFMADAGTPISFHNNCSSVFLANRAFPNCSIVPNFRMTILNPQTGISVTDTMPFNDFVIDWFGPEVNLAARTAQNQFRLDFDVLFGSRDVITYDIAADVLSTTTTFCGSLCPMQHDFRMSNNGSGSWFLSLGQLVFDNGNGNLGPRTGQVNFGGALSGNWTTRFGTPVSEPASLTLLGAGFAGLAVAARRRRKAA